MSNRWPGHKPSDDTRGVDRRRVLLSGGSLLASSALTVGILDTATSRGANAQASVATSAALPSDQIGEVATNSYIYAYPLIMMEMTRRVSTNVTDAGRFGKALVGICRHFLTLLSRMWCAQMRIHSIP